MIFVTGSLMGWIPKLVWNAALNNIESIWQIQWHKIYQNYAADGFKLTGRWRAHKLNFHVRENAETAEFPEQNFYLYFIYAVSTFCIWYSWKGNILQYQLWKVGRVTQSINISFYSQAIFQHACRGNSEYKYEKDSKKWSFFLLLKI